VTWAVFPAWRDVAASRVLSGCAEAAIDSWHGELRENAEEYMKNVYSGESVPGSYNESDGLS